MPAIATRTQADFEKLVRTSRIREMRYKWNDMQFLSFGIAFVFGDCERWWFCSHERVAFGDTLEEVVRQAEKRYPEIRQMFGLFKKA